MTKNLFWQRLFCHFAYYSTQIQQEVPFFININVLKLHTVIASQAIMYEKTKDTKTVVDGNNNRVGYIREKSAIVSQERTCPSGKTKCSANEIC